MDCLAKEKEKNEHLAGRREKWQALTQKRVKRECFKGNGIS